VKSHNLTLTEAVNAAIPEAVCFEWHYTILWQFRNDDDDDDDAGVC